MSRSLRLIVLAGLAGLTFFAVGPTRAETSTGATTDEAWFAPPPTCALPLGCGPTDSLPPVSRYPAGTLHVGVTAGLEDARSYLKLDLGSVPSGATLTGGTLIIPVAGAADGTSSPETAQLAACFATSAFTPVEGSLAPPPAVDCGSTSLATYAAGPPAQLTIDLAPFASRWAAGETNYGIALMPAPGTAPPTTWHVAFSGRARTGSDVPAARVELTFDPAPALPSEPLPDVAEETTFSDAIIDLLAPPPPQSSAAAIVDQARLPSRIEPAFEVSGPGFAYPVVMAAPLVLLALGGYLGWALTRPVVTPH